MYSPTSPSKLLGSLLALTSIGLLALMGGCSSEASSNDESIGSAHSALTPDQCSFFDINGKVQICHKTASLTKPYTILRVSEQACVQGHSGHAGDYITSTDPNSPLYDPTCSGGGCLPVNAPCDATLPCCDGSTCTGGVCVGTPPDPCDGVSCEAIDQCHEAGVPTANGLECPCTNPSKADGSACNDGSACTTSDACAAGTCAGSGNPCANGGSCGANGDSYSCTCAPGWTDPNCGTDIDECESNPCLHGQCNDQINHYLCACDPGWSGTNCDIADPPSGYDCNTNNPCTEENLAAGLFYFPSSADPNQFIQCAEWGQCYVMSCPPGLVWLADMLTCGFP